MLLFAFCVYAGWRAYSWKAPLAVAAIATPLNLLLVWGKITEWRSAGILGRVRLDDWFLVAGEVATSATIACFIGWGVGRVLRRVIKKSSNSGIEAADAAKNASFFGYFDRPAKRVGALSVAVGLAMIFLGFIPFLEVRSFRAYPLTAYIEHLQYGPAHAWRTWGQYARSEAAFLGWVGIFFFAVGSLFAFAYDLLIQPIMNWIRTGSTRQS